MSMQSTKILQASCAATMLYVVVGAFIGIELKVSCPPFHICEYHNYRFPWVDSYCGALNLFSAPTMALMKAAAFVVSMVDGARQIWMSGKYVDLNDFLLTPIILLFVAPLGFLIVGSYWFWRHRNWILAYGTPVIVAAEIIWDGVTGIYGIT